jgi:hypothetical protein
MFRSVKVVRVRIERSKPMRLSDLGQLAELCTTDFVSVRTIVIESEDKAIPPWVEPASLAFELRSGRTVIVRFRSQRGFVPFFGAHEDLASFFEDLLDDGEAVFFGAELARVPDIKMVSVWRALAPLDEDIGFGVKTALGWWCWIEEGDESFRMCDETDCESSAQRISIAHRSLLSRHDIAIVDGSF